MNILVAEDEKHLVELYEIMFEAKKHNITKSYDGEECIKKFKKQLDDTKNQLQPPYDVVILDYMMPKQDGISVAKEILRLCPNQRIIFASAYVESTLIDSIKNLKQIVETIQKPFAIDDLIDMVEDKHIYDELKKLNVNIQNLKELEPSHDQIRDYLAVFKKLQNAANVLP